eukprot:5127923-Prorocentrum_lima.AAC.1
MDDRMLKTDDVILPFWNTGDSVMRKISDNKKWDVDKGVQYKMNVKAKYWALKCDVQGYSFPLMK